MPKHVDLIYKLEGTFDEGIDIFELSPVLLSLGQLIKESKETLYPDDYKVAVNVKPFEKSSFIVDVALFAQNNYEELINLLSQEKIQELKNLLEWIGLVSGGTTAVGVGLIQLIKFLKGPPKTVERVEGSKYKYESQGGEISIVDAPVHQLFNNAKIIESVINVYQIPLGNIGANEVTSYLKNKENESKIVISKSDIDSFKSLKDYTPITEDKTIAENRYELWLTPKRGNFDGDPRQWTFWRDSKLTITATFKDEAFLHELKTGKKRLHSSEMMKVKILEKQKIVNNEIRSFYEILEVLDYDEAPKQTNIFNKTKKEEDNGEEEGNNA